MRTRTPYGGHKHRKDQVTLRDAPIQPRILEIQRLAGNKATCSLVERSCQSGAHPAVQRVLMDRGADLKAAEMALKNMPAPAKKPTSLFGKIKSGITGLFNKVRGRQTITPQLEHQRNASWGADQMLQAMEKMQALQSRLSSQTIGSDPGARKEVAEEVKALLTGIVRTGDVLAEGLGTLPAPVKEMIENAQREMFVVNQLASGAEPPGIKPDMNWLEAMEVLGHARAITEGIDEAAKSENGLGALNRNNTAARKAAYGFAGQNGSTEAQGQMIAAAMKSACDALGTVKKEVQPTGVVAYAVDEDVQRAVELALSQMSELMFPSGLGYVDGNMLQLLTATSSHVAGMGKDDDWKSQANKSTVANVVFLRNIMSSVTSTTNGYGEGTKARLAAGAIMQILQRVVNGQPPNAGRGTEVDGYATGPASESLLEKRNAFLDRIVSALSGAGEKRKVGAPS